MNGHQLKREIEFAKRLLEMAELLSEENLSTRRELSIADSRRMTFLTHWETLYEEREYRFLLEDGSILDFWCADDGSSASYTYLACPFDIENLGEMIEGDSLRDYPVKENPVALRYDWAASAYRPGIHPASHLHLGKTWPFRIGFRCVMTPRSFVQFVLRQCYGATWEALLHGTAKEELLRIPNEEEDVLPDLWQGLDRVVFHLTRERVQLDR